MIQRTALTRRINTQLPMFAGASRTLASFLGRSQFATPDTALARQSSRYQSQLIACGPTWLLRKAQDRHSADSGLANDDRRPRIGSCSEDGLVAGIPCTR